MNRKQTTKRSVIAIFVVAVIITVALVICMPALDSSFNNGKVVTLTGWEKIEPDGERSAFNRFGDTIDEPVIILAHSIADISDEYNSIGFYNYYSAVEVYVDYRPIYSYGSIEDIEKGILIGNYYSMIDFRSAYKDGSEIEFVFSRTGPQTVYNIKVGSGAALEMDMIREYISTVIAPIIALAFLIIILFLRKRKLIGNFISQEHIWLITFVIMISVWELADSQLLMDIGIPAGKVCLLSFETYMLVPIPLLMYMSCACKKLKRADINVCYIVFANFCVLNVLQFTGNLSFVDSLLTTHICTGIALVLAMIQVITEYRGDKSNHSVYLLVSYSIFTFSVVLQYIGFFINPAESNSHILQIGTIAFAVLQIVSVTNELNEIIEKVNSQLSGSNKLLTKTFGKFIPDKLVKSLVEKPEAFGVGGNTRVITVLQADIRGFTGMIHDMTPNDVITMLNHYLEAMTEIIQRNNGTVIEFIGDGIVAAFDSAIFKEKHADRAVITAIQMQNSMEDVNNWNRNNGFPSMDIGIGIDTGNVFIGYIGSKSRMKYDVIGNTMNMCSRIESYSTGGQVLISESARDAATVNLVIANEYRVFPKGAIKIMTLYHVAAIGEPYNLTCDYKFDYPVRLEESIDVEFVVVEGKHCEGEYYKGRIIALADTSAIIKTRHALNVFDDIRIGVPIDISCKVVEVTDEGYLIRFTSISKRGLRNE